MSVASAGRPKREREHRATPGRGPCGPLTPAARRRSRATPHKPFSEHSARSERIAARSRRLPGQAPDYRLAVIGGGIVGLAAAYELLLRRPGLSLAVVEKEP